MKIKFLFGYSGRETAMKTYDVDDVADIPTAQALQLVYLGVAEEVEEEIEVTTFSDPEPVFITPSDPQPKPRRKAKK